MIQVKVLSLAPAEPLGDFALISVRHPARRDCHDRLGQPPAQNRAQMLRVIHRAYLVLALRLWFIERMESLYEIVKAVGSVSGILAGIFLLGIAASNIFPLPSSSLAR